MAVHRIVRLPIAALLAFAPGLLTGCDTAPRCTETRCSDDATALLVCEGGEETRVECMRKQGQLCEAGRCVDPWRYGAPVFSSCPDEPLATRQSLAEKAAVYDAIAVRLHIHPKLAWLMSVMLPGAPVPCAPGQMPPCVDPVTPATPETDATYEDVEQWMSGENDGLWSALYLASLGFRWAVTREPPILDTMRLLLDGERVRMGVTGVPGVFVRQYVPPGVPGIACPTDDAAYTTDAEKDDNRWVQIRDDGCIWVVSRETGRWTKSDRCGLGAYAGYCWLDNVSKDEYSGHMLALGVLAQFVDDAEIREAVADLAGAVGAHLVDHHLEIVDWDGRVTEHGHFSPHAFDDFPGFNAAMAMSFMKVAAVATGRADLRDYYDRCLLLRGGPAECYQPGDLVTQYMLDHLPAAGMYVGKEGCKSNYNNISMHMLSLHNAIWLEHDPAVREALQRSLDVDVVRAAGQPRAVIHQNNALFDFIWAAHKKLGPGSDGPAFDAVENGVCMLRQFRPSQAETEIVLPEKYKPYCKNRFDKDVAEHPRMVAERCSATFVWWGDPYSLSVCSRNDRHILPPTGYLLAYWMGRYYGFIEEDW